jgi:hypothetical protein
MGGDVAVCIEMAFVLFLVQTDISLHNKQHTRHFMTCCHISTHNIKRRDFTECFNRSVTLARVCTSSLRMVEDRNM